MNDKAFEAKVTEDLDTMKEAGASVLTRIEDRITQSTGKARDHLTTWAGDGAAEVSRKVEAFKDGALDRVAVVTKTVEQDLTQGLNLYNGKVQELADQIPGDFSKKLARYPWVAISVAMIFGIFLGMILKPTRRIR